MLTLILTILIILLGSAVFSGSEAALFSLPMSKVRVLVEQKKPGAKNLLAIKKNIRRPITAIVILNNAFNIVGSIIVGVLAAKTVDNAWIGAISAILTFLIIIVGEIFPKAIGESHNKRVGLAIAKPLLLLTKILYPIVWIFERITDPFTRKKRIASEAELRALVYLSHQEGSIETDERDLIHKVFRLNDVTAEDIMTPRSAIEALEGDKTLAESENKIYSLSHTRLPIFSSNLDNIMGICLLRDLLTALSRDQKQRKISEFRQRTEIVHQSMRADKLLPFFQKRRGHLVIVEDEYGKMAGVVSLEDVLEELVGEIVDETDKYVDMRKKPRKNSGLTKIRPE